MNEPYELDTIERYLRETTAEKAVSDANKYGWTEVQSGAYLSTSAALKIDQTDWDEADANKAMDFSKAPYWITTDDGQTPKAIMGATDETLRSMVDVDAAMNEAAVKLDTRDTLAKTAQAARPAQEERKVREERPVAELALASVEEVMAHRSRGMRM